MQECSHLGVRLKYFLAEGVAQEVFLRLARYCPFQKLQTAEAFRAYVFRVAQHECNRHLKRRPWPASDPERLTTLLPWLHPDSATVDPSANVEVRDVYDRITRDRYPVDSEIFRLTNEGYSAKQIADQLALTPSNVDVRRHRGRVKVRKYLKNEGLVP